MESVSLSKESRVGSIKSLYRSCPVNTSDECKYLVSSDDTHTATTAMNEQEYSRIHIHEIKDSPLHSPGTKPSQSWKYDSKVTATRGDKDDSQQARKSRGIWCRFLTSLYIDCSPKMIF